jgi:hypothetical protein
MPPTSFKLSQSVLKIAHNPLEPSDTGLHTPDTVLDWCFTEDIASSTATAKSVAVEKISDPTTLQGFQTNPHGFLPKTSEIKVAEVRFSVVTGAFD